MGDGWAALLLRLLLFGKMRKGEEEGHSEDSTE